MRFTSTFAGAAALALCAPALGEDLTLTRAEAPIRSVTVYATQALVKREAAFEAKEKGALKVTLARLPGRVRDESVRVRSGEGLVLLGSRVVAKPVGQSSLAALETLRADLRKVKGEWEILNDGKWVAEQTIAHVKAIQAAHASESSAYAKADAGGLTSLVEWAEKTLVRSVQEKRAAQEKLGDLEEQARLLERKIAELEHVGGVEKDVEVELEAAAPGKRRIEVEYVTEGASWTPTYDFRADADAAAIDVTYYGTVRQQTGEDWEGVRLALSTARPELGARPPELGAWFVQMRPRYGGRGYDGGGAEMAEPTTAGEAPALPSAREARAMDKAGADFKEGETRTAAVEARGATVAFAIPSPETIPSDGKEKRTTIGKRTFKPENRYFTAPKAAPFAYLRSTVANGFPYPMLAGQANVFFGPDFVGRARTELVPPGEKADIYLGVDERVKVERKTEKRFRDTKGILSTDVRERYEFKIVAKNTRAEPIQLTVVDQVPVSRDEEIRIEDVKYSIEPAEKKEATGEVKWSVGLAPKAETTIGIGFTVRFPEKREGDVVGIQD